MTNTVKEQALYFQKYFGKAQNQSCGNKAILFDNRFGSVLPMYTYSTRCAWFKNFHQTKSSVYGMEAYLQNPKCTQANRIQANFSISAALACLTASW